MAVASGLGTTILIVEDDANIAELIRIYLENNGFCSVVARDGTEALEVFNGDNPGVDLVVLDLMLPGMDGWEVCRWLRRHTSLPVIILTARGELQDKLRGFDLGADDYIVKPFDPLELVARVKAILRRAADKPHRLELPDLVVDLNSYTVKVGGKPVELTPREIKLLYFLASHPNRVFTRELLLQHLWGFGFPGQTRTVDVHINRIRKKIGNMPRAWQIKTVWGVGYKFVLEEPDAQLEHLR
jgi:DNA-binding response OmpR family regulator